jgi:N-methylhydantoinase A
MYNGISGVVSRYGIDPRSFSLLPFGGAGPMMACFIAREVGIRHIVVPTTPGVLSALGGLIADLKNDFVHTVYLDLHPAAMADLAMAVRALRERGERWLRTDQHYDGPATISVSAEMRYKGQSFEIDTTLQESWFVDGRMQAIADAFHARHLHVYGYADPSAPVQIVALRVVAAGVTPKPQLARIGRAQGEKVTAGAAEAWIDGGWRRIKLYDRAALLAGLRFDGPAIVTQSDCTTCILPGFAARIDDYGSIHLETTS